MSTRIINIDSVELHPLPPEYAPAGDAATRFEPRIGMLGRRLGALKLGYNVIALAPGKRAFPFHNHRVNEEMFFVLSGQGEVRIGDTRHPIRAGDVIACPAGDTRTAHQIVNSGDQELRYLAISTQQSPEICEYPDSSKYSTMIDGPDGFRAIGLSGKSAGYWDGE
ncbi:cupin domain-containing protein [Paraburkholderia sp. IW21]|uniref:cupin domain-containing protein n=1 Tax=Paraburkholderia sp. IW21 TaxID=3242488 RepID=UPI00351FA578